MSSTTNQTQKRVLRKQNCAECKKGMHHKCLSPQKIMLTGEVVICCCGGQPSMVRELLGQTNRPATKLPRRLEAAISEWQEADLKAKKKLA